MSKHLQGPGQGVSSYLFSPHDFVNMCHCLILSVPIISMNPNRTIIDFILLHEKFLQFDWLRAVVFQLNLKYLHVKITNPLRVVV